MVALPAVDGRSYVYRVDAPAGAARGDLFWEAWHCHADAGLPRAYDVFDAAVIWSTASRAPVTRGTATEARGQRDTHRADPRDGP